MSLTETFNLYVDKLYFNIKTLYLFGGKKYTITFYLWNLWFGFVDNKMILTQWIKEVPLYAGADTWMVTFLPGRNENWHQPQTQLFSASLGALHCPAGRNKRGMHGRVKWIKSGMLLFVTRQYWPDPAEADTRRAVASRLQPRTRPHIENMQIAKIFRLMIYLINWCIRTGQQSRYRYIDIDIMLVWATFYHDQ